MTLAMAWVRKGAGGVDELVTVSDSRLNGGGRNFDCVPKILPLKRNDSIICFAGETDFAYPLMLQLSLAIEGHFPAVSRAVDMTKIAGFTIRTFNQMLKEIDPYVKGQHVPKTEFILAGYSWQQKSFKIWRVIYNKGVNLFELKPCSVWHGPFKSIAFAGDWAREAEKQLYRLMTDRYGDIRILKEGCLDMEPFEVLRNILRAGKRHDTVGGAPQMVKVYCYPNARPVGIFWPDRAAERVYLLGRQLLLEEKNIDFWQLNPDTLDVEHPLHSRTATGAGAA
ncbi:hypothetical protein E4633_03690 [Geomonas terrae]|uniref:Uncharacterized protein n=1 Tax=Geomonas terrae TaxID=2562681 RepID=A0A4S1CLE6_9BACT|nr:hypothetical protein [Geomonas terrae]TGU74577.1 hypothetical protein E4633_03690 [Geomonas terrae]